MNIDALETVASFRVARTGLATVLLTVLRPRQARAITIDVNALQLEYRSRSSEIYLGTIESAKIEAGWIWPKVRLRFDSSEAVVSGLLSDDAQAFTKALETARAHWWRQTLESQIGILHSVYAACRPTSLSDTQCLYRIEAKGRQRGRPTHWPLA